MNRFNTILVLFFIFQNAYAGNGEISGVVKNDMGEPLEFASVVLELNNFSKGTLTDANGNFSFKPVQPGVYTLKVSYIGYKAWLIENFTVSDGQVRDFEIALTIGTLEEVEIKPAPADLINLGYAGNPIIITSETMENMPTVNPDDIASAFTPGIYQSDSGRPLNSQGSRSNANQYIVDGVKIIGKLGVPSGSIKEMVVISGGMPAKYGDCTGALILITTKSYEFF